MEDCGEVDDSFGSLLLYPVHEDIWENLHRKVTEVGETPWNVVTLIRHEETSFFKAAHTLLTERRQVWQNTKLEQTLSIQKQYVHPTLLIHLHSLTGSDRGLIAPKYFEDKDKTEL